MTTPIPLFVELCAGTAAVSLRLHRDGAKPPVSRMGAKSGYASALLRILGLIPGQRADRYLWCEPDPGVRLLLHAYRSAPLARAAAAIIRGWAAEDPRALWERLRAEGPPRLPEGPVDAGEVARWLYVIKASQNSTGHAYGPHCGGRNPRTGESSPFRLSVNRISIEEAPTLPATVRPDARDVDPREVARWAQITASNRLIHTAWSDAEGRWVNTGNGGATFGGDAFCSPPERTAEGFDAAPGDVPAVVAPDARGVDPREVARWAHMQGVGVNGKGAAAGFGGWERPFKAHGEVVNMLRQDGHPEVLAPRLDRLPDIPALIHPDAREVDPREVARWALTTGWCIGNGGLYVGEGTPAKAAVTRAGMQERLDRLPEVEATIHPDARDIDPPALPPGTIVYADPPYQNTTPYAHDLPRAEVVALARRWAAAGATVAISEAEPIPELVAEGWHAVEITNERIGQARTFSRQKSEWVTLNRPPAWVPPVQGRLF